MSDEDVERIIAANRDKMEANAETRAEISLAQAPAVLLRRDPIEAVASCRREGWVGAMSFVCGVFTIRDGAAVRVIMRDGRSGTVKWDAAPNNQADL